MKTITDYKGKPRRKLPSDASLPDELNAFYARFEASNTEAYTRTPAVLDDCVITLSAADVSKTFKQVNIHKAAGPDGLPGSVLKGCVDQLASVFTESVKKKNVLSLSTAFMCKYLYERNNIQQRRHKLNKFHRHVTNRN